MSTLLTCLNLLPPHSRTISGFESFKRDAKALERVRGLPVGQKFRQLFLGKGLVSVAAFISGSGLPIHWDEEFPRRSTSADMDGGDRPHRCSDIGQGSTTPWLKWWQVLALPIEWFMFVATRATGG